MPTRALLAAALVLLAGAACRRAPQLPPEAVSFGVEAAGGEEAPPIELPAMGGARFSLGSLRGQVVLVNFWATWCPPCREEMPSMLALGRELESKYPNGFKMVAVSLDEGWDPIGVFFKQPAYGGNPGPLTVVLDRSDQATAAAYYCAARGGCPGEYKVPESYIIDRKGRLVSFVVGPRDWSDPRARTYLEGLIR